MNAEVKRELLESFPLSGLFELESLLELYSLFDPQDGDDFKLSQLPLENGEDDRQVALLEQVEDTILPAQLASKMIKKALSTVFLVGCTEDYMKERTFLEAICTLLGRRGPKPIVEILSLVAQKEAPLWVYRLAIASHVLYTQRLPDDLNPSKTPPKAWTCDEASFCKWATWDAPGVSACVSTFFHLAIFDNMHPFPQAVPPLLLPQVDEYSVLWNHSWDDLPLSLALLSPTLGDGWRRLYSSDCNGFSFRTMQEAVLTFHGPTVILLRTTDGDVIGYSTDCPWKLSRNWYGEGSDSFIFTLSPKLAFYPATGNGNHYQYLNLPSIRHASDLRGMAIGGIAADRPRLFLNEKLEKCRACDMDVTFAPGPLLSDDMEAYFDVDVLEVWATNETEESFRRGVKSGELRRSIREATRQKIAKVEKEKFVDDLANGVFHNKAFVHRDHTGDRHDYTMEDFKERFAKEASFEG